MGEIKFLTLEDVQFFHKQVLDQFGGQDGLRDLGLLESALAQPKQMFGGQYLHEDLASMAAAYLYHITSNHPFFDGNKRAGFFSAFAFLELNSVSLAIPSRETELLVVGVASSKVSKEQVAEFIRGLPADK